MHLAIAMASRAVCGFIESRDTYTREAVWRYCATRMQGHAAQRGQITRIYCKSALDLLAERMMPGQCMSAVAGKCPEVSDNAYAWASGTSMAVPHAAGVAAIYLSDHPSAEPREVGHTAASLRK